MLVPDSQNDSVFTYTLEKVHPLEQVKLGGHVYIWVLVTSSTCSTTGDNNKCLVLSTGNITTNTDAHHEQKEKEWSSHLIQRKDTMFMQDDAPAHNACVSQK